MQIRVKPRLFLPLAVLIGLYSAQTAGNPAGEALQSLRAFFAIDHGPITFTGLFVDTPAEYGSRCELVLDLSSAASGYISLRGEHAPKNSAGEGVYFADADYRLVEVDGQSIVLSQTISDGFGNDVATELQIGKQNGYWLIDLKTRRSFWWLTDTAIKHCKAAMTDRFIPTP